SHFVKMHCFRSHTMHVPLRFSQESKNAQGRLFDWSTQRAVPQHASNSAKAAFTERISNLHMKFARLNPTQFSDGLVQVIAREGQFAEFFTEGVKRDTKL